MRGRNEKKKERRQPKHKPEKRAHTARRKRERKREHGTNYKTVESIRMTTSREVSKMQTAVAQNTLKQEGIGKREEEKKSTEQDTEKVR